PAQARLDGDGAAARVGPGAIRRVDRPSQLHLLQLEPQSAGEPVDVLRVRRCVDGFQRTVHSVVIGPRQQQRLEVRLGRPPVLLRQHCDRTRTRENGEEHAQHAPRTIASLVLSWDLMDRDTKFHGLGSRLARNYVARGSQKRPVGMRLAAITRIDSGGAYEPPWRRSRATLGKPSGRGMPSHLGLERAGQTRTARAAKRFADAIVPPLRWIVKRLPWIDARIGQTFSGRLGGIYSLLEKKVFPEAFRLSREGLSLSEEPVRPGRGFAKELR